MMRTTSLRVGDLYPVWWWTGVYEGERPLARILAISPYEGRYPELFNVVLTLYAPRTAAGVLNMAVCDENRLT